MNNGDLISRKALVMTCKEIASVDWNKRFAPASWTDAYESFVETIEDAPAVDAVEVVRCRECKHREDGLYCRRTKHPRIVTNVDFCSYGERRSE